MIDIIDKKGIADGKLEHIFLGTIKSNKTSGFHCDKNFGDEKVYAEAHLYSQSKRVIIANRDQKIFEADVREKRTFRLKDENGGRSTFFNADWSRQDVVDCIARLKTSGKTLKEYSGIKGINHHKVCIDKLTGVVVVDNQASTYPLLKY